MLVCALETSTPRASVALVTESEVVASYELGRGKSQDQVLVPGAERLLEDANLTWDHVGGIAVGLGPGMFTGLRIGVATGKALAQSLGISIAGLSSLDVLAHSVRYTRRVICTCVDARRNEVFWTFYRATPGGVQRLTDFRFGSAEHCCNEIEARGEPMLVVGNGAHLYPDAFSSMRDIEVAGIADATPTAIALGELAVARLLREDSDRLADVRPLYVRKSDAEVTWERVNG